MRWRAQERGKETGARGESVDGVETRRGMRAWMNILCIFGEVSLISYQCLGGETKWWADGKGFGGFGKLRGRPAFQHLEAPRKIYSIRNMVKVWYAEREIGFGGFHCRSVD